MNLIHLFDEVEFYRQDLAVQISFSNFYVRELLSYVLP